jgi:hypothetical protein
MNLVEGLWPTGRVPLEAFAAFSQQFFR